MEMVAIKLPLTAAKQATSNTDAKSDFYIKL